MKALRSLFFLLALCGVASGQTVVTFSVREPFTSYGYTPQQMRDAIPKAFAYFERNANVDLRLVPSGGQYVITSGTLHLGGGYHARGWQVGNIVSLHNGWVPGHMRTPDKPRVDTWWKAFSSEQAIASILAHEIGHLIFGAAHSSDPKCIMHSNASTADLCPAEKARLVAKYGPAKPTNRPPVAKPDIASVKSNEVATIGPLANDPDPDGDKLTITKATTAFASELKIVGSQVTFKPITNKGTAVINYTISDGKTEASSTITVTVVPVYSWTNPVNKYDVNNDGQVTSLDALTVINAVARGEQVDPSKEPAKFYDVNGDMKISSLDGLLVVNELNRN